ncbi:muscular LMNA-interacting protein isoform X12 [Pogona vitticeps]
MEVEKHNREASARDTLRKEKRKVPSESGFLRFTFVPTFGTLPTQFHVADTPAFLVGLEGEPADKNYQENARNRNKTVAEEQALGSGEKGKSDASGCINSGHSLFQPKEPHRSRQKMDRDDLFKAEFVFLTDSDEDTKTALGNGSGGERSKILETSCVSARSESRGQENVPQLPFHPEPPYSPATQHKQSQIRTSYKAFAAIPTNTLLLEQKALDEPTKPEALVEDKTLDTHSEMCSPAQLRQQTEELCAAIDQVLQDPLAKHQQDSSPRSLQNLFDSDVGKPSTALQRSAGRETRYANLYLSGPAATESQKTKPGVIRPTLVKAKIMVKEEEPIQPNPFKKYLEETSDPETEEDSSLVQPFPPTKPKPTTKSTLHPLSVSHADSLTPGPFNHVGSTFGDIHDYSYTPYQRNALYKKHTHPIVPIPENEALSSKEIMRPFKVRCNL